MPSLQGMRFKRGVAFVSIAALIAGCAGTGGQGFALFPTGHFLLESTKQLRDTAAPDPEAPRELSKMLVPPYIIQPGDGLLVETEALDSPVRFPSDQTVLPDGVIDLGKFGRRVVAGKTVEQIEEDVQELVRASGDTKTVVNARLTSPRSAVYYVLGEVNSPGAFPLIGRETVLDGILAAGGTNARASKCNVILSRPTHPNGCRVVLPVCYRHVTQMGDTTTNYQLMPGDRIYVATRTFCEQLTFWRQNRECCYCSACQVSCGDGHPHNNTVPFRPAEDIHVTPQSPSMPENISAPSPFDDQSASRQRRKRDLTTRVQVSDSDMR